MSWNLSRAYDSGSRTLVYAAECIVVECEELELLLGRDRRELEHLLRLLVLVHFHVHLLLYLLRRLLLAHAPMVLPLLLRHVVPLGRVVLPVVLLLLVAIGAARALLCGRRCRLLRLRLGCALLSALLGHLARELALLLVAPLALGRSVDRALVSLLGATNLLLESLTQRHVRTRSEYAPEVLLLPHQQYSAECSQCRLEVGDVLSGARPVDRRVQLVRRLRVRVGREEDLAHQAGRPAGDDERRLGRLAGVGLRRWVGEDGQPAQRQHDLLGIAVGLGQGLGSGIGAGRRRAQAVERTLHVVQVEGGRRRRGGHRATRHSQEEETTKRRTERATQQGRDGQAKEARGCDQCGGGSTALHAGEHQQHMSPTDRPPARFGPQRAHIGRTTVNSHRRGSAQGQTDRDADAQWTGGGPEARELTCWTRQREHESESG